MLRRDPPSAEFSTVTNITDCKDHYDVRKESREDFLNSLTLLQAKQSILATKDCEIREKKTTLISSQSLRDV